MTDKNSKKRRSKTVIKPPSNKNQEQMSMDELRSVKKKKINRHRKFRRRLAAFGAAVVVMCIGAVLVLSLCFKINTVTVEGDVIYSDAMVAENCGVEIGSNLFTVSEEKISEALSKALPYIKSATIERKLPDTLVIKVQSTEEVAAFSNGGYYVLIDTDGKVLRADASVLKENVAIIENVTPAKAQEGKKLALNDEQQTEVLLKVLSAIGKSELNAVTKIDISNVSDITLEYEERITLEIGSLTNIETKLSRARAAIEKENEINAYSVGVLDLKTEPYAYFKAGNYEEETTAVPETGEGEAEETSNSEETTGSEETSTSQNT